MRLFDFFIMGIVLFGELFADSPTILVFGGKTGWIGQKIVRLLEEKDCRVVCGQSRIENRQDLLNEICLVQPHFIINCAGITGRPNVDWCESHKQETIRTNIIGTLNLADVAYLNNIHLTNVSTGCIYEYDEAHSIGSGIGFTEDEKPNFEGSFYSITKIRAEEFLLCYPNVLNLRLKMPVDDTLDSPYGFLNKIKNYKKLVNVPNSLCALWDLLPIAIDMTLKRVKGNFNFVNPGTLSHKELMDLYKIYIDPSHSCEIVSLADQEQVLKGKRSNAELSPTKLMLLYPDIPNIKDSIINFLQNQVQKDN